MLRWGLSLLAACAVALALFVLMMSMVAPRPPAQAEEPLRVADYVTLPTSDSPTRERRRAAPPAPPQPPTPPPPSVQPAQVPPPAPSLPSLALELPALASDISLAAAPTPSLSGLSAAAAPAAVPVAAATAPAAAPASAAASSAAAEAPASTPAGGQEDSEVVPLNNIVPTYPRQARQRGIEGHVRLAFTITREGGVENIRVLEAQPRHVFEREARRAAARWRFAPRSENGLNVAREATKTLYFRLQKGGR